VDSTVSLSPTVTSTTVDEAEYTEASVSGVDGVATDTVTNGTPVVTTSSQDTIADVDNGNGTVTRTTRRITTTTTTTPKTTVTTVQRTLTDKIYKNVITTTSTTPRTKTIYGDGREVITLGTTVTVTGSPVKTFIRDVTRTETVETNRVIENIVTTANNTPGELVSTVTTNKTVSSEQALTPTITTSTSEGAEYVVTTYTDSGENTVVTTGTPFVSTSDATSVVDINNVDGSTTRNTYTVTTTTTVTPKTTTVTKIRTYTDVTKKDITTTTTTVPNTRTNYSDSTYIDRAGTPVITTSTEARIISNTTRTDTITVSSVTEDTTTTSNNSPGVLVSTETVPSQSLAYTDNDPNLGTRTTGYNTNEISYKTNEYLDRDANGNLEGWATGGKQQVKASTAYSRGWTGKGVKIGVVDTGYDLDHTEFSGQISATRDFTDTGMNDTVGHGTHVLGSMVAKKDSVGSHGVAYDATAVVAKAATSSYISMNTAASAMNWIADQGAVAGNLSANTNYDPTFYNSLTRLSDGTYKSTDSRYNYGNKIYYNMQDPAIWKSATDKGLIVVNSAGNQGLSVPANPGYFATATDANGNLLLGGRMLIVGAVDQDNNLAGFSNQSGHICQNVNVVDNSCNDTYKVSDFYILAPGYTYSAKNDGTYGTMIGTSMAAPYVTGGVAIISQMWPYMKGENLVRLLTTTACKSDCISDYNLNTHGSGLMDLDKATRPVGAVGIPTTGRTTSSVSTASLSNSGGTGSSISAFKDVGSLSKVMIVDEFARDFYVNLTKGITVKDKRKVSDVKVQQNGASYLPFHQSTGSFEQGGEWKILDDLSFGFANTKDTKGDYSSYVTKKWGVREGLSLRTTMGTLGEKNTWLGNQSSGALAVGKNNNTYFSQVGLDYIQSEYKWSIDLGQGFTRVNTVDNSLIKNMSTIQSQSIKLGMEKNINETSKWGITVGMPNYISKGSANLSVPYATTLDGDVVYDNVKANLRTRTPEKNLGLYYTEQGNTDLDWSIRFNTELRNNIAGEPGKKGVELGMTFEKKFWGSCGFGPWLNMKEFCVKMREDEENFKKEYAKKSQVYEDMLSGKNPHAIGWNK
jgi:subtilisin family serine protease